MIALLLVTVPAVVAQWNNGPYQPNANFQQQPYQPNGYQNNNNNNWVQTNNGPVYLEGDGGVPNYNGAQQNQNWNGNQAPISGPVYQEGDGGVPQNGNWNGNNQQQGNWNQNYNNNNNNNNNGFNQPMGGVGWEPITNVGFGSVPLELAWRAARQEVNRNFGVQQNGKPLIPVSISSAQKNSNGDIMMQVVYAEATCFGNVDISLISSTNCYQYALGQKALYSVSETRGRMGGSLIIARKINDVAKG